MFGPASNNDVVQHIWLCEFSEPCGDGAFHNRVVTRVCFGFFPVGHTDSDGNCCASER